MDKFNPRRHPSLRDQCCQVPRHRDTLEGLPRVDRDILVGS